MSPALSRRIAELLRAAPAARAGFAAVWLVIGLATPILAADRAANFLESLRERGWNDVALEYLEAAQDDPLATQEFLDRVDFERAATLVAMAKASVRDSERLSLNQRAVDLFQKFAEDHPDAPQHFDALSQAANLLSEQALALAAQSDRTPSTVASQRDALRAQAREKFEAAEKTVDQLLADCDQALKAGGGAPSDQQMLIVKQAEGRFLAANLLFDKAKTYDSDSKDAQATLEAAAKAFADLHENYSDKLVGFYGQLYEGRAYQALGKWDEALECYGKLAEQPIDAADFRRIVARAYRYRAECYMATNATDKAIAECSDWLDAATGDELKQPEWLAVAFRLAEACDARASKTDGSTAGKLHAEARQWFRAAASQPGEFQFAAQTALGNSDSEAVALKDAKSFADAFVAGKQALERMNAIKVAVQLAEQHNPDTVAELQQRVAQSQTEAQRLFETALKLASDDAQLDDLLAARHFLCWIYWEEDRIPDAAVLGEYIARRHPESSFAASAAKVALAAWEKMYRTARQRGEDGRYETENLASLAELTAKLWPESPEAGTAVYLLMQIALADGRLQDAEALLGRLPETSRATAQLSLGGSLWARYLQQSAADPNGAEESKVRALELLSNGYQQLPADSLPSSGVAIGVLYYVQALLAKEDSKQAMAVLENPSVGPLAIVSGGKVEVQPAFVVETYKSAVRAYLSVDPPQPAKIEEMMTALEKSAGTSDQGQQQLASVYLGLGLELQQELRELMDDGKQDQAQAISPSLEALLKKIAGGKEPEDWKVRTWIAQTHFQLGQCLTGDTAKKHFVEAEEDSRSLLDDVAKDPKFAPNELAVLAVRKQLGDALRAQLKYDRAFQQYVSVLRQKSNMLDLQQEAASLLQEWGQTEKRTDKLEAAIRGSDPLADKKNLVWGWRQLADIANQAGRRTAEQDKVEKFQNLFFAGWLHIAECRLQIGLLADGDERAKHLDSARQNIESMKRLYPDLGGPKWQQAFEDLLKQIESARSS